MAIYTYNNDIHRFSLTEKIFRHYKNIQEKFKDSALFTFTILGSENEISKNLTLKYFESNAYIEFDQKNPKFKDNFYEMLGEKINLGIKISARNGTDIILWAGSNDYICVDFFEQIISFYKPDVPQIYGIDNFNNGKNAVFYTKYDGKRNHEKLMCLSCHKKFSYWWNGISDYCDRKKYKYCGGIIGINRKSLTLYPDILKKWSYDEGEIEEFILSRPEMEKFKGNNLFYMNIKSISNNDVTGYDTLKELNKKNTLNFNSFSEEFKKKFITEFYYFEKL